MIPSSSFFVLCRWDWHAWQFLLALLPAGSASIVATLLIILSPFSVLLFIDAWINFVFFHAVIYSLAQYARYDMAKQPEDKITALKSGLEGQAAEIDSGAAISATAEEGALESKQREVALEQRLATVEATLLALQSSLEKKQEKPPAAAAAATPPSGKIPPP